MNSPPHRHIHATVTLLMNTTPSWCTMYIQLIHIPGTATTCRMHPLPLLKGFNFWRTLAAVHLLFTFVFFPIWRWEIVDFCFRPNHASTFDRRRHIFFFGPHLELVLETNGIDSPLNNAECQTMNSAISFLLHRLQNST